MPIKSVMPSNHLSLCHPLLLLPSIFPSIRVFSSESVLHIRWPKYWTYSFSISPSNEYSGLISFRMDWLDLLAVQGTLKSLLQHHSSKASFLWHSAFFTVQLSHPYMTIGKTIALTRQTFIGKVMLCFLICCLGWSSLFFQGASLFQFHGRIIWLEVKWMQICFLNKAKHSVVSLCCPPCFLLLLWSSLCLLPPLPLPPPLVSTLFFFKVQVAYAVGLFCGFTEHKSWVWYHIPPLGGRVLLSIEAFFL